MVQRVRCNYAGQHESSIVREPTYVCIGIEVLVCMLVRVAQLQYLTNGRNIQVLYIEEHYMEIHIINSGHEHDL